MRVAWGDSIPHLVHASSLPVAPSVARAVAPSSWPITASLMLQDDDDNMAFANNCLEWLTQTGNDQRRDRVLYVEDGVVRTDFYVPLEDVKLPPLTLEKANRFLAALEEDNTINKVLSRKIRPLPQPWASSFMGSSVSAGSATGSKVGSRSSVTPWHGWHQREASWNSARKACSRKGTSTMRPGSRPTSSSPHSPDFD